MPGDFLQDDLDIFLNTSEFASDIFWTPLSPSGVTVTIQGIFDAPEIRQDVVNGEFVSTNPQFITKTTEVSGISNQDIIQISGTTTQLRVAETLDDGTGMTTVFIGKGF